MIKTNKRTLLLTSLIIVLPLCIGLILWNQLPDTMATHFGIHGDVDGFSSKPFAILFLPIFILAIHWFSVFIISADPRKKYQPKIIYYYSLDITHSFFIYGFIDLFIQHGLSIASKNMDRRIFRFPISDHWQLFAKDKTELYHWHQSSLDFG